MSAPAVSSILFALRTEARDLVERERAEQAARGAGSDHSVREEARTQMLRALLAVMASERTAALSERITLVETSQFGSRADEERYGVYRGAVDLGGLTLLFSSFRDRAACELGLVVAAPCSAGGCRRPAVSPHCGTWRDLAHALVGVREMVCETCRQRRAEEQVAA